MSYHVLEPVGTAKGIEEVLNAAKGAGLVFVGVVPQFTRGSMSPEDRGPFIIMKDEGDS